MPWARRCGETQLEGCSRLCKRLCPLSLASRLPQRPLGVTVSYQDVKGEARRLKLDGFQARIFQHEFDHLQGVLFQDRMSPEVLATVQPQLEALERAWAAAQRKTRR